MTALSIFGKIGTGEQIIDCSKKPICPEGFVKIKNLRPETELNSAEEYILSENLTWEKVKIVPTVLSRFQAITMLRLTKVPDTETTLYDATDMYINELKSDTTENIVAKTAWETAQEFQRNSTLILLMQSKFNLKSEDVDNIFITGSNIKV